jgi:hypothetical protein
MLDCPVSGTGSQAKTGDLVIYASGDRKAIGKLKPMFAGFSRKDLRRRRVRQRQPDEIRRQPAGGDQQRGFGRGDGDGHEGRPRPQDHLEMISQRRRQLAVFELRAPMMVKDDYTHATMKCSVWQKDMSVIDSFARKSACRLRCFSATQPVYDAALKAVTANTTRRRSARCWRPRRASNAARERRALMATVAAAIWWGVRRSFPG